MAFEDAFMDELVKVGWSPIAPALERKMPGPPVIAAQGGTPGARREWRERAGKVRGAAIKALRAHQGVIDAARARGERILDDPERVKAIVEGRDSPGAFVLGGPMVRPPERSAMPRKPASLKVGDLWRKGKEWAGKAAEGIKKDVGEDVETVHRAGKAVGGRVRKWLDPDPPGPGVGKAPAIQPALPPPQPKGSLREALSKFKKRPPVTRETKKDLASRLRSDVIQGPKQKKTLREEGREDVDWIKKRMSGAAKWWRSLPG